MAYSFTVDRVLLGGGDVKVIITETDCGPTDQAVLTQMPRVGTVVRQTSNRVDGSAATVNPVLGWLTDPAGDGAVGVICQNATPAALCDNEGNAAYAMNNGSSATLYHQSLPDSDADNVVETVYLIRAGL